MKLALRSTLTDLKAAVRISHPDAIYAALEGLSAQSEIGSNQVLPDEDITQYLLPIGIILAHPRCPASVLEELAQHQLTAFRAIAAISQGHRFLQNDDTNFDELTPLANDARAEIRFALVKSLASYNDETDPIITTIIKDWLSSEQTQVQQSGLQLIAHLATLAGRELLEYIDPIGINSNPSLNQDVVAALVNLAQHGASDGVIWLLSNWAKSTPANTWVITRTLAGSWAAEQPESSLAILKIIALGNGVHKQIVSALRALIRHGATEPVQTEMEIWHQAKNENQRAIADKMINVP